MRIALSASGEAGEVLDRLAVAVQGSANGTRGVEELRRMLALSAGTPCGRRLSLDPSLARGLSYYTGPIYEVQVPDLAGSLGGGGRYDELIGMFLKQPVPAVGFSLGLERILVVMAERKMFPDLSAAAQVMVLRLEDSTTSDALQLAAALRAAGVRTELYPSADKLGKQLQYAEARKVQLAVFVGEKEKADGQVAVKIMAAQQQQLVARDGVVEAVKGLLE
ncbi:MAG: ATP phosphoribosyltransferase regulatory subunit [Anaeromyxobacter sp.]